MDLNHARLPFRHTRSEREVFYQTTRFLAQMERRKTCLATRHRFATSIRYYNNSMKKLLIADDNPQIVSVLEEYARAEGFDVFSATDGDEALTLFQAHDPDVVLLDVMMPKKDGFEVCRTIRATSQVPIIMVTARSEDFEKIMGLEIGADDYVVKPFSPGEVMARVKAVLRRTDMDSDAAAQIVHGTLTIDRDAHTVTIAGKTVPLSKKEFNLLWTLAAHPDRAYPREQLFDQLWGYGSYGDVRTVDTHIKRLRAKLNVAAHPDWDIETVWGVGYKLKLYADNQTQADTHSPTSTMRGEQ